MESQATGLRDYEADNRSEEPEGVVQTVRRSHARRHGRSCLGRAASRDDSIRVIRELEQKKDLEVLKENISGIELRKPTFVHRGHIVVSTLSGDPVRVIIADKGDYQRLEALMRAFRPDAVTLV